MQIGVLEPVRFSPDARSKLASLGTVTDWDGADLRTFLEPLEALFVRLGHRIDARFLTMSPRLKWLCSPTTGHTHLDEPALAERGVRLLSLRGERAFLETIRATPEHTFGLILALLRQYRTAFADVETGRLTRDEVVGEELFGNHVGIIGLGRVGFRVADYCAAFGAHVSWYDPADVPSEPTWVRMASISALIDASRIVVICASFRVGQPPPLGPAEIGRLAGRYLVNTARGELVDEPALLAAIRINHLAGVAVDVIDAENGSARRVEWRALAGGRNVILTPHIGGATVRSMALTECFIADKLAQDVARQEASA